MQGLWVDLIVVLIVGAYAYTGYKRHFVVALFELAGVVAVILFAFKTYPAAAFLARAWLGLFRSVANMAGFLAMLLIGQVTYYVIFCFICHRLERAASRSRWARIDTALGVLPGLALGVAIATIFVSVLVALPVNPRVRSDVTHSRLGGPLFASTGFLAPSIETTLGQPSDDLLAFLTPRPSDATAERLDIPDTGTLTIDVEAEQTMLGMVNRARIDSGAELLVMDSGLRTAARAHSREMWQRKYFAHDSPYSGDLTERLLRSGARFTTAGENIALAPDVLVAFRGLMNSPGHRANILDPQFKRIGIGVVSAGILGEMFTQEFTD